MSTTALQIAPIPYSFEELRTVQRAAGVSSTGATVDLLNEQQQSGYYAESDYVPPVDRMQNIPTEMASLIAAANSSMADPRLATDLYVGTIISLWA